MVPDRFIIGCDHNSDPNHTIFVFSKAAELEKAILANKIVMSAYK